MVNKGETTEALPIGKAFFICRKMHILLPVVHLIYGYLIMFEYILILLILATLLLAVVEVSKTQERK